MSRRRPICTATSGSSKTPAASGRGPQPGHTPVALDEILGELDYVLLMCVNPGRGSQPFIESSRSKIAALRGRLAGQPSGGPLIEIDGGVNAANIASLPPTGPRFSSPEMPFSTSRIRPRRSPG